MKRNALALIALLIAIVVLDGCDQPTTPSAAAEVKCRVLGEQLHNEALEGVILGDIRTKIKIRTCPKIDMRFASLAPLPDELSRLAKKSAETMEPVGFKASASGFVVRNGNAHTFIALTLSDVEERHIDQP